MWEQLTLLGSLTPPRRAGVALRRQHDGSFLQSSPSGDLQFSAALGWNRSWKMFSLTELAVPAQASAPLPLRATLCGAEGGAFLGAGACGKAACCDTVACCSEEWLLDLAAAGGGSSGTGVWSGDGRQLLSVSAGGELLLRGQHGAAGREAFSLQLLKHQPRNSVALWWQPPGGVGGPQGVAAHSGVVTCGSDCKPDKLSLAIASGKPALLVTAHGQLLGACLARPQRPVAARPVCPAAAALHGFAFQHHGDGIYSILHTVTGQQLCVDAAGVPQLSSDPRLQFPHPRTLWAAQLTQLPLPAAPAGGLPEGFLAAAGADGSGEGGGGGGGSPPTLLGWTLRTQVRQAGSYLYLSAHPGGLVTTASRVTRWELWTVADLQVVDPSWSHSLLPGRGWGGWKLVWVKEAWLSFGVGGGNVLPLLKKGWGRLGWL